jgi:hypothetical protein
MIDFTKEELSLCYRAIEYMLYKEIWFQPETSDVLHKLQSMIDSYCKHEEFEVDHNYEAQKCKQCSQIFIG